jgi:sulfur-oxidizing protein SoxZ
MARALVNVPAKAKRGQVIEIKTLFSHIMETGFRHDESGRPIPRDIVNKFVCFYNNVEVFRADLFPAISANPFITFSTVATESGVLALQWTDDKGETYSETARITVE